MPQQANITVKKANGTTDYVFVATSASPGDGGFAQWEGEGPTRATKGQLRVRSVWNRAKTARRIDVSGMVPHSATDPATGVNRVVVMMPFEATFTVPNDFTAGQADDSAAIITNALASTLMKSVISSGFAPT